jgi:hypothetical protein
MPRNHQQAAFRPVARVLFPVPTQATTKSEETGTRSSAPVRCVSRAPAVRQRVFRGRHAGFRAFPESGSDHRLTPMNTEWVTTYKFVPTPMAICTASVQDHRFREDLCLRRLCPEVVGFVQVAAIVTF